MIARMLTLMMLTFLQAAPAHSIKEVAWLSGCWDLSRNARHVTESWTSAEGGTMMGIGRTVEGGKTTEWEFLLIREGATALEFVARPSGQREATFAATRTSASQVVFENPAHDFPQKITYQRDGDSLLAVVEGPVNGRLRRIEFKYARAVCGS